MPLLHVRNWLPVARWIPHDLPSQENPPRRPSTKPKSKTSFWKPSSSSSTTPDSLHHRKSTISLSSTPDPDLDARTHAQDQSLFFTKLPIEVRKIVYEYVMGSETVHLTLGAKKRFGHFICEGAKEQEQGQGQGQEQGMTMGPGIECECRILVGGGKESTRLSTACVRILRVCRRIYSEAIPHLYTPHTFSLLHLTHLLYLPTRLPTPRLHSIRTLRLRWAIRALPHLRRGTSNRNRLAYPEDTANWLRAWAILADMQSLRNLHVVLCDPSRNDMWERSWLELEDELLEPVKEVVRPRWFVLVLPYATCETEREMGLSRVRLVKPEGEEDEEDE